jgi:hypothetical protein
MKFEPFPTRRLVDRYGFLMNLKCFRTSLQSPTPIYFVVGLRKTGPHVRQQLCYQLTHCLLWIDCDTSENLCLTCWIFHKILKGISPALLHSSASKTQQRAKESTTIIMAI